MVKKKFHVFVFVFVSSESFPILFCCVHGNVPPLSLQSLPTNIGSHTDEGIGRPTYMLLKRRNWFQSKTNLALGMCFWWRGWYIQDSAPSVWGNTRQNLRLLFEFCKEHSRNWRIADTPLDHIWLNWVPNYGKIRYLGRVFECAKYGREGYP